MDKIARKGGLLLIVLLLAGCQSLSGGIQPGDKIGNTEFINVYEECQAPNFSDICGGADLGFRRLLEGTCEIPAELTRFWISISLQGATQEELEANWEGSKWEMTYDGQPVDLEAFGTFDWVVDDKATRSWNVCVANPTPGRHNVVYKTHLEHGDEPGNFVADYSFRVLAPDGTPSE